eukprot:gene14073-biopygen14497
MVTKTLHCLGIEQNKKKGVWEPTQLVEHLGLEVNTKDRQFNVTPQRIGMIRAGARHLLSTARPTTVRLHTDSFLFAWGRRLQSEEIGAGFWNGDDLGCHITHLELEAITSREPALMWRMRRLRILLDLHNIELTTRHIRGEAKD